MTHMKARGRIVVGVDGSAAAAAAVRWAVREARLRRTAVHLVCACDMTPGCAHLSSWSWPTRKDDVMPRLGRRWPPRPNSPAPTSRQNGSPPSLPTSLPPARCSTGQRRRDARPRSDLVGWRERTAVSRHRASSARLPALGALSVVVVAPDDQVPGLSPALRRRPASAPAS